MPKSPANRRHRPGETLMPSLRDKLVPGKLLTCPGVFDGISLRLADRMGFECLYMTGYGTVASHLGLPDAGLASYRDMVDRVRSEEHTSELQSLMRISYAVFCLKKKTKQTTHNNKT